MTLFSAAAVTAALGQSFSLENLPTLTPGQTKAQNALWLETPLTDQFKTGKQVVIANVKGPAVITMMHFALGQSHFREPITPLNRDVRIRMFWDGETSPSVDVPLVDFFCDPAGLREEVNTVLVNKRRGFNAYFPMPFRSSGRVELLYDGPVEPGEELWRLMPAYSYVMYRTLRKLPKNTAYFHASWRQESLLLGKQDYLALDAKGHGKFVGWNVTMRKRRPDGYPVDQNEKFYIDGEKTPSVEFQGIEDSFGFSWGFPPTESQFPLTGFYRFLKGAAAYRFFLQDAINFEKSLRVTIGFGEREHPMFRREYSKSANTMQLSSTVYWYQTEPHAPLPPMPPALERAPAPEEPMRPARENLPAAKDLRARGVKLLMWCGRKNGEIIFAEPGFNAVATQGYAWEGWSPPVYHCRADNEEAGVEITVPKGASGTVRIYLIDPDDFEGGRKQTVSVAGDSLGTVENFDEGRWLEHHVGADKTGEGKVLVRATNARQGSNAVLSIIEWVEDRKVTQ